ncbi:MAG: protein kinase domain-containing protein [Sciscionella sp.]
MVLDRYRIEEELGSGGMGVVWLATDLMLDQPVAMKRVSFAHLTDEQARLIRDRTLREARLAAKLRGTPHVVALYDVQVAGGDVWLVMEHLPSRSLSQVLADRGRLDPGEVARIGTDVADALARAHAVDVQHRDVTPGNVLIGTDGVVKLTDFGLAHHSEERSLTETSVVTGTIAYIAPEVARGYNSTSASDVFALGATLYAAVEGQPPFGRVANSVTQLHLVASGIIRPPENAGPLTLLLLRMLEVNPAIRPDATTLREQLHQLAGQLSGRLSEETVDAVRRRTPQPPLSPHGAITTPPLSSQGPDTHRGRFRRPALLLVAALLVVGALALATVLHSRPVSGTPQAQPMSERETPTGTPQRPPAAGDVRMPQDTRSIDTCKLLDPRWLRQFGNVAVTRDGAYFEGCRARITGKSDSTYLELFLDPPRVAPRTFDGREHRVDGLTEVDEYPNDPLDSCHSVVTMDDNSVVYVDTYPATNGAKHPTDLCALARTGAVVALNRLAGGGMPRTPGVLAGYRLSDTDACSVLDDRTLTTSVPGLNVAEMQQGMGGWSCFWGSGDDGRPHVALTFSFYSPGLLDTFGDATTVAGRHATVRTEDGSNNKNECAVRVQHTGPNKRDGLAEVVEVEVDTTQPPNAQCVSAKAIATKAETSLGG